MEPKSREKRIFNNFLINTLLIVFGLIIVLSGLALQLGYHRGEPGVHQIGVHEVQHQSMRYEQVRGFDTSKIVCGFNYPAWSAIHKFAIVFFSLLMIYHICAHWKWYEGVIAKHLIRKNIQVITLSVLFLLVVLTGFIPWIVDLSGNSIVAQIFFIEIHDKLALFFILFLVLHIVKRAKWFATVYEKLKK
jgi:hypothetical protein